MKTLYGWSMKWLAGLALALPLAANAAPQNFEGVVSDSMCVKKHMMPGKSDAECVRECVKSGSKYVLVSGGKVYTLEGNAQVLWNLAGQHVQLQGELKGNVLKVASMRAR